MKTLLYDKHQALGAQFVDFGDWQMPLQYRGIREEHDAVRKRVGVFDVSHMGRIAIEGPDAEIFMDYVSANKISGKQSWSVTYTLLCRSDGTCVDDTLVYCIDPQHYFIVANASNRQKDLVHLQNAAKDYTVSIIPYYNEEGILALQGPASEHVISAIFPESRALDRPMRLTQSQYQGVKVYISSTGYTGESGFEVYAPSEVLEQLWDEMLQRGAPHGILPVGLGARNTLRLEMGYALYGHEIDSSVAATESVAAWSVKLDKPDFIGRTALIKLEGSQVKRFSSALHLLDPGVLRDNYLLFKQDQLIGRVTSGGYSPTLNRSIGLALTDTPLQIGDLIQVQMRGKMGVAEVVKTPFIKPVEVK